MPEAGSLGHGAWEDNDRNFDPAPPPDWADAKETACSLHHPHASSYKLDHGPTLLGTTGPPAHTGGWVACIGFGLAAVEK